MFILEYHLTNFWLWYNVYLVASNSMQFKKQQKWVK